MIFQSSMADVLRRTRSGDLRGATELIRAALAGAGAPRSRENPHVTVIDRKPERVSSERTQTEPARATGSFEARHHAGPAGAIDYMLYRPAGATAGMPLVVMLHGCTQSPEDFARGTGMNRLADDLGFLVAYPRQTASANQQKCWNWFRPGDQARGRGEPALIAGVARAVIDAERADATRVYVAGLSAGGAAAAIMADAYPDVFAAVGVHSGLACGAARDLPGALAAMKRGGGTRAGHRQPAAAFVPLITFHGDRDRTVDEANARELVSAATAAASGAIDTHVESGTANGRRFTRALGRDAAGRVLIEQWTIAGAGHAWSGGDPAGSYTDREGPSASREMVRFFLEHRLGG